MKAYTIESKTGIKAVILPEKGATAISLQKEGREFLYCDEENLESPERPRCGIPFLFPIFGRLKEGKYTWEGKDYAMEIHGFGHTSSWQVAEYTEDTLQLILDDSPGTGRRYGIWPGSAGSRHYRLYGPLQCDCCRCGRGYAKRLQLRGSFVQCYVHRHPG